MGVLLTGGHGALGRFVAEELVSRGHGLTVFDLDDDTAGHLEMDYDFVQGDVTDYDEIREAVRGADAVIHMAALKRPACEDNPRQANEVNIGGTLNVFESAVEESVRVIHISTKSVFGHVAGIYSYPTYAPLPEDAPQHPVGDVYGLTKRTTEDYQKAYQRKYDLDVASFRFASTYGPGKVAVQGKGMLIPNAIESAMDGQTIELPGGDEYNDWVYFGDVANGLVDAVDAPELNYPAYHIGTGELHSVHEFARVLEAEFPECSIAVNEGTNPQGKAHPIYARMDISRARSDLDYEPEYSIAAGIRDYVRRLNHGS